MFTNKGRPEGNVPLPEAAPQQRRPVAGRTGIASIIANGVKITGTIEADGAEVQIDGEVEGNVRGGTVTVGDSGMIKGDVICEAVTIHGRVEGSVRSRKVQLQRNAHVVGDIVHQSLAVEMGAVFEGQCRYLQDPLRGDASTVPMGPHNYGSQASPFGEPSDKGPDRMIGGMAVSGASS
jgi:cytoskeletal protein CcmA (bactofilin family)